MPQGNRRHIAPEQKRLITIMANYMSPREIATATHISKRTVYRTIATWRSTGKHAKIPLELGRPRILTPFHISICFLDNITFLEGLVLRTPDIYLVELQTHLYMSTGLYVAQTTIHDALRRRGYTRKRVSAFFSNSARL
ncbi:hypothetical protein C8J57DRAFT_1070520 [Mycena rebaudengoi]|nr:hypothetical protein C8J57DRAFT_1070520 [Mycena rebaudengoi]